MKNESTNADLDKQIHALLNSLANDPIASESVPAENVSHRIISLHSFAIALLIMTILAAIMGLYQPATDPSERIKYLCFTLICALSAAVVLHIANRPPSSSAPK